ncbi:hypothetical protein PsorP6_001843 [Peronosclerospora sorghi]|uniref:Uncharacterized protein n=1 Tax=Peronosclerospora sorghi TaxID=230839 RepID=A0ACC0WSS6_9STRA|nr:hypothetical protein PsorP6_001843 [Peronosclerospora sorghi]
MPPPSATLPPRDDATVGTPPALPADISAPGARMIHADKSPRPSRGGGISNARDSTAATAQCTSRGRLTSDMRAFTIMPVPRTTTAGSPRVSRASSFRDLWRAKLGDVLPRGKRRRRRRQFSFLAKEDKERRDQEEEEEEEEEEGGGGGEEEAHVDERKVTRRYPSWQLKIESTSDRAHESFGKDCYMYSYGSTESDPSFSDRRYRWSHASRVGGLAWRRVPHDRDRRPTIAALVTATRSTVWHTFLHTIRSFADEPAITGREIGVQRRRHRSRDVVYSWAQHAVRVRRIARRLIQLGFCAGEGVVMQARTSPLLHAVHLAVVALGGVVAHVQSSWTAAELCQCIFPTSNATLVVVDALETNFQRALETLADVPETQRPRIRAVIVLDSGAMEAAMAALCAGMTVMGARDLLPTQATTDAALTPSLDALARRVGPDHCCLLAFEYDHVGRIRGAELSHDNVLFTAAALVQSLELVSRDRLVGYLPLHHVASQVLEFYVPLVAGLVVICAPTYELPLVRVVAQQKPTVFFATPATWTRFRDQVYRAKSDVNAALYSWAKTRATKNSQKLLFAKGTGGKHRSVGYMLAKTLVLDTIKKKIGLEGCHACYSILAPLEFELERLFKTVDTPIYQLYGTPETSGFAAINFPHAWELGSSGRALPGTTIRCDGQSHETVLRGRNVFLGYRSSPGPAPEREDERESSEQRASTCDADGWLRLGQRGFLTPNGFLTISDPPDFIVLATGDWIPIRPFERAMVELMPELDRAVLIGDGRPFLSALFFLKTTAASGRGTQQGSKHACGGVLSEEARKIGSSLGSSATTVPEAMRCQHWAVHFDAVLEELPHVCPISGARVRKWILMATSFSVESGELDPETGNVCRRALDRKYQALLDSLYS